ncbi:GFA family protein [Devosia sp. CN2-171]|uniref:GFA family protein n=1 Tax=Devosia sp. CN2-171 TaxID=3400909 RepID=UPI003BF8AC27
MSKPQLESRIVHCRCGEVEIELAGPPILVAACHCDDCQAGAAMIEALPGATPVLDAYAGTPSVLYRKDRVHVRRGGERLKRLKLQPDSPTNRDIADCCNTPLMVTFDNTLHWIPVYSALIRDAAPPLKMRVNTRYIPDSLPQPHDVPSYRHFPLRFVLKLVTARLGMLLGR